MLIQFWCPSCRALHAPAEVEYAPDAGATPMAPPRCPRSGLPVEFRAIPDDPDDERYALPRCPTCYGDVRPSSRFCTRCGAPQPAQPRSGDRQPAGVEPNFADRVLAAVAAECRQILRSVQAEGPGRAPTQCILVESERGGPPTRSWLYDLTTNRLVPFLDAPVDMRDEPVDGMYFRRAMIQYSVVDERRALEFSCTLGPRFGRGLVFDLVEEAGGIRLANQRMLWIS
jgi:hypothetical protein